VKQDAAGRDPLWFRVLDRFGFPTLVGVALLAALMQVLAADRRDRSAERERLYVVMDGQAKALQAQTDALLGLRGYIDGQLAEMRIARCAPQLTSPSSPHRR
jgi:hypothetical protein